MTFDVIQPSKSFVVDVSVEDQVLGKKPCLIRNNQSTGADINILLEGDTTPIVTYFEAGQMLNAKVIKVLKANTTSGNIVAYHN